MVELGEELPTTGTFVTGYRIHPFVGRIPHPGELDLEPNPTEVETVLTFSLDVLREGYGDAPPVRRGVPIHTPTYEVEGHLIWGATARIVGDLLSASLRAHPVGVERLVLFRVTLSVAKDATRKS